MSGAACSWRIGDASPDGPALDYAHDLNHTVHAEAAAHFGPMRGCRWAYFTNGESEFGRADFLDEIAKMGGSAADVAKGAAEWDGCQRPIAVTHVGVIPESQS